MGRSLGGFASKINAMVGALGNPLKFLLSAGQQRRYDIKTAMPLIEGMTGSSVLADRDRMTINLLKLLKIRDVKWLFLLEKTEKNQQKMTKAFIRSVISWNVFFGKIKYFRRIFSHFDKTAQAYIGFLNVAAIFI
ncbi:MAG: hypothetical protein K0M45_11405 [Candidatus Paracaedibacteraceae bacterium]|nr:hypothetical protein [Candidatus Paracaedibacteraceae bacterium]